MMKFMILFFCFCFLLSQAQRDYKWGNPQEDDEDKEKGISDNPFLVS